MFAASRMPSVSHPKSVTQPNHWNEEVEEAYRFQQAGYRDETEYKEVRETDTVSWLWILSQLPTLYVCWEIVVT